MTQFLIEEALVTRYRSFQEHWDQHTSELAAATDLARAFAEGGDG